MSMNPSRLSLSTLAAALWVGTGSAVLAPNTLRAQTAGNASAAAAPAAPQPDTRAMRLFHGSISYLSLLFLAVAIDPFLG